MVTSSPDTPAPDLGKLSVLSGVREYPTRVKCASLTAADLPGFGDRKLDNRPRLKNGKVARAWNTMRPLRKAVAVRDLRDRARMVQSIDRMVQRMQAAAGR